MNRTLVSLIRPALAAASLLSLVNCSTQIPVVSSFKQARGSKVAVITMAAPTARVMQQGGEGIVDHAINQATSSGRNKRLADYPSQARADAVAARFASRLNSLGYKATQLTAHPTAKEFNHYLYKPGPKKPLPGADSYLKGFDSLLVIDMPAVGQSQLVYAFVPLSDRKAVAAFTGSLISCSDGKHLWRSSQGLPNYFKGQSTEGTSADTANIFKAIDAAVDQESRKLETEFFTGL